MKKKVIKLILKYGIFSYNNPKLKKMAEDIVNDGCSGSDLLHALQVVGPYRRSTLTKIGVSDADKKKLTRAESLDAKELMDFCKKAAFLIKAKVLHGGTNKEFNRWYVEPNEILGIPPAQYMKAPNFATLEKLLLSL